MTGMDTTVRVTTELVAIGDGGVADDNLVIDNVGELDVGNVREALVQRYMAALALYH